SRPRSAAGIRPRKGRRKHERDTGPQGVRRALRRRRAAGGTMSAGPALLLAGDVGATKTNLALFTTAGGVLTSVAEANFVNGGNAALIAAGTGLGEAVLYWDGTRHRVSASEAGHADFAPRDVEQIAILGRLMERFGHVSWERVVSGPGLHNIYAALAVAEAPE